MGRFGLPDGCALLRDPPRDANEPRTLAGEIRRVIRSRGMSPRTEKAYATWIRRFLVFHRRRHPKDLGRVEIEAFLSDLTVRGRVSASTQNQALSALLFLYREVYGWEFPWLEDVVRAKRPRRLPVVLTRDEAARLLGELRGVAWIQATPAPWRGSPPAGVLSPPRPGRRPRGARDLVRDGKGRKDRRTVLPEAARGPLVAQVERVRRLHDRDLRAGLGTVALPDALARKYPGAAREWGWQWVFPASRHYVKTAHIDPNRNIVVRLTRRFLPVTGRFHGEHFMVRAGAPASYESEVPGASARPDQVVEKARPGVLLLTPLALALVMVEATDLIFAVDSIPAIFAITVEKLRGGTRLLLRACAESAWVRIRGDALLENLRAGPGGVRSEAKHVARPLGWDRSPGGARFVTRGVPGAHAGGRAGACQATG